EKWIGALKHDEMHRYSLSRGITPLREAICNWYKRRYDIELDPETEAIVTIGSKEGLAHLAMAVVDKGDTVLVPNPSYPIHPYGFIIAGADVLHVPIGPDFDFFEELERSIRNTLPKPKMLLINFPSNPTAQCVDLAFFERVIEIAKEHDIWVIQDLAYADIVFDGYKAPSILEVPGAKDIAVEFFSLSKSYNMPGWRVGFMVGNQILVNALTRMKSYLDYGLFAPIQAAAVTALEEDQQCVADICSLYQHRRNVLCDGLNAAGWSVERPRGTMFVWAPIPEQFQHMGSLEFSKKLLTDAKIAVSPGVGFGEYGDKYVRFALIEDDERTNKAMRGIQTMLQEDVPSVASGNK
ncbi:MAG: aminotransferase class I/II-fold pyridoxal phosphate-dependent enzyme, partial [Proteobacteria bacterium]|nr:aminotransferase class I/II-fold pyridoxal phosphate-dependent enzyme [Pseudomonadota bacterium]